MLQQFPGLRELQMKMNQQRGQQAQPGAQQRNRRTLQKRRWHRIIDLGIQRQQRAAIKQKQRQAKKEEHALKISLPPVADDHHHPEQLQERASSKTDEPNIDE